jgi:hypothetical protein
VNQYHCSFKPTGFGRFALYEKLGEKKLTAEEEGLLLLVLIWFAGEAHK